LLEEIEAGEVKFKSARDFLTELKKKFREYNCYDLKLKGLSNKTTLVLSNTRELNKELFYKLVYLI